MKKKTNRRNVQKKLDGMTSSVITIHDLSKIINKSYGAIMSGICRGLFPRGFKEFGAYLFDINNIKNYVYTKIEKENAKNKLQLKQKPL